MMAAGPRRCRWITEECVQFVQLVPGNTADYLPEPFDLQ